MKRPKIAIVVQGRFHAFDLVRGLMERGYETTLFTNYPASVVRKFGVPPQRVKSYVYHGILSRLIGRSLGDRAGEATLHSMFGRWSAHQLAKQPWDIIYSFTGISQEILARIPDDGGIRSISRGSAHIETQSRLLEEEEERAGVSIEKPSPWMIERERCEYDMARLVIVPSTFAQRTFLDRGFSADKVRLVRLGSELKRFRPPANVVEERVARILSAKRLRVLTVGAFSFRKGALDILETARKAAGRFEFRFVGPVPAEAVKIAGAAAAHIRFVPKQPQHDLPSSYAEADVFLFPTIEDGYAVVLAQAQANGLPILATPNCAAPDLVAEGKTGWILPIRDPAAFLQRLQWCDEHRRELAEMARHVYDGFKPRDWTDVADDFVGAHEDLLMNRQARPALLSK